jgi:hypothetical protein
MPCREEERKKREEDIKKREEELRRQEEERRNQRLVYLPSLLLGSYGSFILLLANVSYAQIRE